MHNSEKRSDFRVAVVSPYLSGVGGGAPRSAAMHAYSLQLNGVHVTLFAGFCREYPLTLEIFPLDDCEVVASRIIGPSVLGVCPSALAQLARRAHEFDFIQVNMAWNLNTFLASRIALRNSVPYIFSLRSHLGEYHFSRIRWLKPWLYRLLERRNVMDSLAVHVTSDWEITTSKQAIQGARAVKIPNAMDIGDLSPIDRREAREQLQLDQDGFHIVSFGRLGRQKNPHLLLDAFAKATWNGKNAHLHFVGPPEYDLKQELLRGAQRCGVEETVHFVDYASGDDRLRWLSAGDVFALPSFDENFCIAAIEAAACGTHCVVSPHVGAIEYLPSSFVDVIPLDVDSWGRRLQELSVGSMPQTPLPRSVLEQFSPESVGAAWLRFYQESSHT